MAGGWQLFNSYIVSTVPQLGVSVFQTPAEAPGTTYGIGSVAALTCSVSHSFGNSPGILAALLGSSSLQGDFDFLPSMIEGPVSREGFCEHSMHGKFHGRDWYCLATRIQGWSFVVALHDNNRLFHLCLAATASDSISNVQFKPRVH